MAFTHRHRSRKVAFAFVTGAALAVIMDSLVRFGQFAVVYPLIFLLVAPHVPRRSLWRMATMLVLLIYVGFLIKLLAFPTSLPAGTLNYRLLNRTIVAAIMLALVPIVTPWLPDDEALDTADGHARPGGASHDEPGHWDTADDADRLVTFTRPLLAGVLAVFFALVVAVADLITPAHFNLAVFYALPLLVISWTRRPILIWASTMMFLLALLLAFRYGPASPEQSESFATYLAHSRWLTAFALVTFAGVLHVWVRRPGSAG